MKNACLHMYICIYADSHADSHERKSNMMWDFVLHK